ncbi:MAG: rhomboid family intramembrane serine protease [Bdellovibrionaceae bacterium]|nr:rhomboid family intramembrane serine protease [Pseudobdellovibrionaceae bacterium]
MASSGFRYHIRILNTLLSRPNRPEAGLWTVVTTLALFSGCALYWSTALDADTWMPATRRAVFEHGEVWRLLTTLFAHSDLGHLLANSLMYVILAYVLSGYFGPLVYPALAWGLAIPMTALALLTYPPSTQLIGASGLVHLMGGLWLSLYFFVSRNLRMTQRILRAVGVMLALFFPTSFEPQISYRVHFLGLMIGLIAGSLYFARHRRELRAQEEVDIEYEPDPAVVAELRRQSSEPGTKSSDGPSEGWTGFQEWDDVTEMDDAESLVALPEEEDEDADPIEVSDVEDDDADDEDDDDWPPDASRPRRLRPPRRGNA